MSDFIKGDPPTLTAETMMVIIPRGAIPSNAVSTEFSDVARNCLVASSPKRVRRALKSANERAASSVALMFAVLLFIAMARNGKYSFQDHYEVAKGMLGKLSRTIFHNGAQ